MEDMSEDQRAMATGFMFDNLISCIPGFQARAREQEMGATLGNT